MNVIRWLGIAALLAGAGCWLTLNWDHDGLPCDDNKACEAGYTCLVNECVANRSRNIGETCTNDVQCNGEPNVVCGRDPLSVCRNKCTAFLEATANCVAGEYCRPDEYEHESSLLRWRGICLPQDCSSQNPVCDNGRSCVPVTTTASSCQHLCQLTTISPFVTNCTDDQDYEYYCQPAGQGQLLCMKDLTKTEPLAVGEKNCDGFNVRCVDGAACVPEGLSLTTRVCRKYCFTSGDCNVAQGEECKTDYFQSAPVAGVCEPPQ